jgi:antitoxin component HigA of HigAB toxin-antitoxin module
MSDLLSEVDKLMTAVRNEEDYDFAIAEKVALLDLQSHGLTDEAINEVRQKIEEKYFTRLSFQGLLHLYKVI